MARVIVSRWRAFLAAILGFIGFGALGRAGGVDTCGTDCPPPTDGTFKGQQVQYQVDDFTFEQEANGNQGIWFIGQLLPSSPIFPPGPVRPLAEGKLFVETEAGPQTFAIGKMFQAPSGSGHQFLFEGHLIPASSDATASDLEQPFEFEGHLYPPGPAK